MNYFKEVVEKEVVNEDCVKKASKINDSLRHVPCVVMKYPFGSNSTSVLSGEQARNRL